MHTVGRTPRTICAIACRTAKAPNNFPASTDGMALPVVEEVTAACICKTHRAKLFTAGVNPAPKLLNEVKATKALVGPSVGEIETKACEQKSIRMERRMRSRSKDISLAS